MEISEQLKNKIEKLKEFAIKVGASRKLIKLINVQKDVSLNNWPRIKCKFGCKNYGKNLCCPPFIPEPREWKEFLKEYKYGILIGFEGASYLSGKNPRRIYKKIFNLERKAFLMGFYKAFIYYPGPCRLCDKCIVLEEDFLKKMSIKLARTFCKHLDKARPSMEATGIDVFSTIRNIGLELEVVNSKTSENIRFYTLLLLE
ncbi:MAG: DUF2284 domain-containing protein [Candidatus Helarchaeota archaeon]